MFMTVRMSSEPSSKVVPKGTILETYKPIAVVPLWKGGERDDGQYLEILSGYQKCRILERTQQPVLEPTELRSFINKLYREGQSLEGLAVLTTLVCVNEHGLREVCCTELKESSWDANSDTSLLMEGWPLIHEQISWQDCFSLYRRIYSNLHIVSLSHPLTEFATKTLFRLKDKEFHRAVKGAVDKHWIPHLPSNRLQASQFFLDYIASLPERRVGIVLPMENNDCQSCLPSATLELSNSSFDDDGIQCHVISLYDSTTSHDSLYTISSRPPSHDCTCLRCTYRRDPMSYLQTSSLEQIIRLAHSLFQQEEKYDQAKELYRFCHDQSKSQSEKADLWHAMGAIELTRHAFVAAQRHWKEGSHYGSVNSGIALQLEKQMAYGYWDPLPVLESCTHHVDYETISPKRLFVTPNLVSGETCRQLIQWAKEIPTWTTSRHYAVPTNDIPIHQVPTLLEWFQEFMTTTCQSLLRQQFGTTRRFYVHDAFLVRYQASAQSHFLPLHYDESTHSMVVALNDDFEGGGSYFYTVHQTISPSTGSVVSFRGNQLLHGGNVVTRGVRYIVAIFLYLDDDTCGDEKEPIPKRPKVLLDNAKDGGFAFGFFD